MNAKSNATTKRIAGKSRTPAPVPPPADEDRTLRMPAEEGKSDARMLADLVTRGDALNALTAMRFAKPEFGSVDLSELAASLRKSGEAVNGGDLSEPERMLHAQAVSLNAIFAELARRAHINMGEYLDASERYMRLALKAQSQCRATLETLASVKNPPIVYARQANIANGPQQVNNGVAQSREETTDLGARTGGKQSEQTKLMEASNGERLDFGTQGKAGRANQDLETLGTRDGAD